MNLQPQVQALIDEAPQDGGMPAAIRIIAPLLQELAEQRLKFEEYYILQNLQGNWQLTTLQHRQKPGLEKTVVYAFANLQDATRSSRSADLVALPVPVIPLLFQLLALEPVDSILFLETMGDLDQGEEITRYELQQLIQTALRQNQPSPPMDIA
ncbi:hypothetical protein [Acaryochloris marina]|uniref:Uncharacterized protein n=1 Tax=Acaryochloris marina (strain MBIC 11017) TaxID=329726 RepID=B0CDL1_ACAM1|nr:hypothetical protein [Acaryochloris marina]ABW28080.1 conserved hypothetical protein [Acaryochloris marina MBIC11017]BDM82789.1 hypothetical protein AM10699_56500 [Acaryochloris marina MBIC10699]